MCGVVLSVNMPPPPRGILKIICLETQFCCSWSYFYGPLCVKGKCIYRLMIYGLFSLEKSGNLSCACWEKFV